MSIKWAPIFNVPLERRLQVFSAFLFFVLIYLGEAFCLLSFVALLIYGGIIGKLFCFLYLVHFYMDRDSHEKGRRGQGCEALRGSRLWRYFTSYFPMRLVKTAELPPNKNYLFAVFPHGVMSAGAFGNFSSNTTGFHNLFPKIRSKFCTLNFHFFVPFYRELFLSSGMISVTPSSIRNALMQSNDPNDQCNADGFTSNAAVIAVGGSQEVVHARPGDYHVVLKHRKGFIKLALQTGASLVPAFSFGENDIYDQPSNEPGTALRKFQDLTKTLIGITPPIVNGRGFFQYSFGLIPRRHAIFTVVGTPIDVIKNQSPSDKEIDELHRKFVESLAKLFDHHKREFTNSREVLLILE